MSFYCALEKKSFRPGRLNFALARLNSDIRKLFSIVRKTKMVLYHCLSKSAMYKQEKRLVQITLLEQPLPIK
jgi:hypothetical protein